MVKSLRCLCLEKVYKDVENYEDLPKTLVKDINLMRVFNGNYKGDDEDIGVGGECLTIHYDGEVWNFSSVSFEAGQLGDYKELIMAEGEIVESVSILLNLEDCIGFDHHMQ